MANSVFLHATPLSRMSTSKKNGKRLAEAAKGVCSICRSRVRRNTHFRARNFGINSRQQFATRISLISIVPTEGMQTFVHYLQPFFPVSFGNFITSSESPRVIPRTTLNVTADFCYSLGEEGRRDIWRRICDRSGAAVHWRKILLAC